MPGKLEDVLAGLERDRDVILAVLVHLNDTYLIEERPEQRLPGFARVTATVRRIREKVGEVLGADRTLVVHSGDFLGPSRVGKRTRGAVMVELLNRLGLNACVLGNHEFDYGEAVLVERMREARFTVTMANVRTHVIATQPHVVWPTREEPILALTGIVSPSVYGSFPTTWTFTPPREALATVLAETPGVPFHVVLTHATRAEDREIRGRGLPPRTVLLGGHDHDVDWVEDDGVPIMKNLSNMQTVRIVLLLAGGATRLLEVHHNYEVLHGERARAYGPGLLLEEVDPTEPAFPADREEVLRGIPPRDAALFRAAWARLDPNELDRGRSLLNAIARLPSYPDEVSALLRYDDHEAPDGDVAALVTASLPDAAGEDAVIKDASAQLAGGSFDARDEVMRRGPTPFGRFVAECVRRACGASVAILNTGAFRADGLLPAELRARDLLDCFLYDDDEAIMVVDLPRDEVAALLHHGDEQRGSGGYPQLTPAVLPPGDPSGPRSRAISSRMRGRSMATTRRSRACVVWASRTSRGRCAAPLSAGAASSLPSGRSPRRSRFS